MSTLTQFHSQLEAVESPTPRDRMGRGKISPMTTQAPGPQVEAKKKIYIQMKAISALTAAGSFPTWLTPTIATMNWQTTMPRAPQIRRGRRPNFSTVQNEMGVEQTLTRVVMRPMRNGFEIVCKSLKKEVPK